MDEVEKIFNKGYKNVTNGELMKAYVIITGNRPTGACSQCFRRNCWQKIIRYLNKRK